MQDGMSNDKHRLRALGESLTVFNEPTLHQAPLFYDYDEMQLAKDEVADRPRLLWTRGWPHTPVRRSSWSRILIILVAGYFSIVGFLTTCGWLGSGVISLYPGEFEWFLHRWYSINASDGDGSHGSTSEMTHANPVACLSHNDEWQDVPLYTALKGGCTGVEADVWMSDNDIFVGHSTSEKSQSRTLRKLYLEPVFEYLESLNPSRLSTFDSQMIPLMPKGVFSADPAQSVILLLDLKFPSDLFMPELQLQLEPLRSAGYLTHFNGSSLVKGPVTVVLSGSASFSDIIANTTYRDVFFDAKLDDVADTSASWPNPNRLPDELRPPRGSFLEDDSVYAANLMSSGMQAPEASISTAVGQYDDPTEHEDYSIANSYFASTSFKRSIGRIWGSRLTQAQLQKIRSQIRGAHQRGLRTRYWGTPTWPVGLRNHVWHVLVREGVDMLGVDDMNGATRTDWRRSKGPSQLE